MRYIFKNNTNIYKNTPNNFLLCRDVNRPNNKPNSRPNNRPNARASRRYQHITG